MWQPEKNDVEEGGEHAKVRDVVAEKTPGQKMKVQKVPASTEDPGAQGTMCLTGLPMWACEEWLAGACVPSPKGWGHPS